MGIFNENAIIGTSAAGGAEYDIDNSCRFHASQEQRLTKTPGSAGNQKTWTVSFWFKKTTIGGGAATEFVFSANSATEIYWSSSTKKFGIQYSGGGYVLDILQKAHMRDFSGWYHVVWAMDTTQSTNTEKMKLYINGESVTISPSGWPATNSDQHVNNTVAHGLGCRSTPANYYSGYIADFHIVDGLALDHTSFGEVDGDYGHWKAKEYTGSHGTNGVHLDFSNASNLGDDAAGSNDWTQANLSTHDKMLDTPTNNFCTLNLLDDSKFQRGTFTEGNLKFKGGNGSFEGGKNGTLYTKNKIYYEICLAIVGNQFLMWGFAPDDYHPSQSTAQDSVYVRPGYTYNGMVNHGVAVDHSYGNCYYDGSSTVARSGGFLAGDILMMAFDPATGKFWYGKNNTWYGTGGTGNPATGAYPIATLVNLDHTWTANIGVYSPINSAVVNFGQDSAFAGYKSGGATAPDSEGYGDFYYTPPDGFLALCSKNQDDCAIKPKEHFNVITYDNGAGAKTGVGFQPDLVWLKSRDSTHAHKLTDAVRGVTKALSSNSDAAESTDATGLTAFGSDGFTVGSDGAYSQTGGDGMVALCWKAGGAPTVDNSAGAGAIPTAGSVKIDGANYGLALAGDLPAIRQSINTSSGFSITKYAGTGTVVKTMAHGLSQAPDLVIIKRLEDSGHGWQVGFIDQNNPVDFTDTMYLHGTNAVMDDAVWWNDTAPSSTIVTLGGNSWNNQTSKNFLMYCWHSVEGYSSMGGYRGNGETSNPSDNAFIYTGFRPRFVLIKRIDGTYGWPMNDSARHPGNPMGTTAHGSLLANDTAVEGGLGNGYGLDFLSNGFKIRGAGTWAGAQARYFYYAVAEIPTKQANAF